VKPYRLRGEFAGLAPTSSLLGRGAEREIYDRRGRARRIFLERCHALPGECQKARHHGYWHGWKTRL